MATGVAARSVPVERAPVLESAPQSILWTMKNGAQVEIRPIRPDDEQRMIKFHKGLSERSVYMRYFESLSLVVRTAHARLAHTCFVDPERQTVLVALSPGVPSREQKILAVGRLTKLSDSDKAEVALLVLDEFQGLGLGSGLLRQLIQAARDRKITQIEAKMLRDNTTIQRVLKNFGFRLRLIDPRSMRAVLSL
jgi:acetyltransferase